MAGIKRALPPVIPNMSAIPGIFGRAITRTAGEFVGIFGASVYSSSTGSYSGNLIYAFPILLLKSESFDRISLYVNAGDSGNAHLGLYADNGNFAPGALLVDSGPIDVSTSGTKSTTINITLDPGIYWICVLMNCNPSLGCAITMINLLGLCNTGFSQGGTFCSYATSFAYASLPNPHPVATPNFSTPTAVQLMLRRA